MTNQQGLSKRTSASPQCVVVVSSSSPTAISKQRHTRGQAKGCNSAAVLLVIGSALLLFSGVFTRMVGLDSKSQSHKKSQSASKFPKGWKEFSYIKIRSHFQCKKRSMDLAKPLPSIEDWQLIRDTFIQVVETTPKKRWEDDPIPPTLGYSLQPGIPNPPPYYAKFSSGKGRGLFASRDIAKGELVHDGDVTDVIFPDAIAWRRFVFSLPRDFACDMTDWNWMQRHEEGGPYFMHASFDISILMNSGGPEFGGSKNKVNAMPKSEISGKFYALRDIEKGEEILTDYDAYYTNWRLVGL